MAKEDQQPTSEERVETVIHQRDGRELRIGSINREYDDGDTERIEEVTEYVETTDGHLWGPHFLKQGAKGGMVVCEACRRRSRSFLGRRRSQMVWTPVASARRCYRCGRYFCSVHYTLSSDNHVRCRHCNRLHVWFHHVLLRLFFREI